MLIFQDKKIHRVNETNEREVVFTGVFTDIITQKIDNYTLEYNISLCYYWYII